MYRYIGLLFALVCFTAKAQDSTLLIGVRQAPPFVEIGDRSTVTGLSADFWNLVEDKARVDYRFKKYPTLESLIEAVRSGEVDMSINPLTVTDERMKYLDFSQPFFISGTAVARKHKSGWLSVVHNIFSWRFVSAVGILLAVIFLFGLAVWYFERRSNSTQFGKGLKGIGDGFWWSAVTMTTVGYGDKAPESRGGRIVGFIWMFAAIIMISGLTAGIASSLTVQSLETKVHTVEDLRKFQVAVVQGSSSANYLSLFNIDAHHFATVEEALRAVDRDEMEMVVYDRPILLHFIEELKLGDIKVSEKNLRTDYYSFSYPAGSMLRDFLDPFIVRTLESNAWGYRLQNWNSKK